MTLRHLVALLLLVLLSASPASADYFRPAYLQLTERGGDLYDVRWKAPAQSETVVMSIKPVFPAGSVMTRQLVPSYAAGSVVMAGQVKVAGGLEGKAVRFEGLADTGNQALVRLIRSDGSEDLYKVAAVQPELVIPKQPDAVAVSARYTQLGIEHILLGFDHLLFVAALFMLVTNLRTLFWTITAFTVAHSITLALVTLDVIHVAVPPVEAFIALSIVFVALEVIRQGQGHPTLASRRPWLVAFTFGLLHGLGFASALAEIGLPHNNVPIALLFFNVGVEIGQLAFVGALILLSALARHFARPTQISRARLASSYAIGGLASFWLIDRLMGFA